MHKLPVNLKIAAPKRILLRRRRERMRTEPSPANVRSVRIPGELAEETIRDRHGNT